MGWAAQPNYAGNLASKVNGTSEYLELYFSSFHFFQLLQYASISLSKAVLLHLCLQMISIVFYYLNFLFYLCCFSFLPHFMIFFFLQGIHAASDASTNAGNFLPVLEATACLSPQVSLLQCLINCLFFLTAFLFCLKNKH